MEFVHMEAADKRTVGSPSNKGGKCMHFMQFKGSSCSFNDHCLIIRASWQFGAAMCCPPVRKLTPPGAVSLGHGHRSERLCLLPQSQGCPAASIFSLGEFRDPPR